MQCRNVYAACLDTIKIPALFLMFFLAFDLLANDIPENDELMSVNFENISLRSLFEIMADHNEVNIETEKITRDLNAKQISIGFYDLSPELVYGVLLDCFGLSSERINRSYVVESVAAPNFSSQACLDDQLR